MSQKEVAATKGGEIAAFDSSEWEGLGSEAAQAEDYAIPFINIAQALSPQLDDSDAAYIPSLKKNQLFNSVTGEIYPEGARVVPVKYERKYLEFHLRENGGGLVEVHETYDHEVLKRRDDKNRSINDAGNQIVETRSFYCLVETKAGAWHPALISMKSTGIKKAKQWMSMVNSVQWKRSDGTPFVAPMFARVYRLGVAQESSKGNTWGNWTVERLDDEPLFPGDALFDQAHAFYKTVGDVKVDYGATAGAESDEDVPLQ